MHSTVISSIINIWLIVRIAPIKIYNPAVSCPEIIPVTCYASLINLWKVACIYHTCGWKVCAMVYNWLIYGGTRLSKHQIDCSMRVFFQQVYASFVLSSSLYYTDAPLQARYWDQYTCTHLFPVTVIVITWDQIYWRRKKRTLWRKLAMCMLVCKAILFK